MKKGRAPISIWVSVLSIIVLSNICHSAPVTNSISWGSGMNVWSGDPSIDGEYWFYDRWSVGGLKTTILGTNNTRLILQPNFSQWMAGTDWVVNGVGTKWMEANTLVEVELAKLQSPAIFSGTINSNNLTNSHKAKAFIKVLDPGEGYSIANETYYELPVTTSSANFSVSLDLTTYTKAGLLLQYGFLVEGFTANPANETALGKADVTVTNIPSLLANPKIKVTVANVVSTNNQTIQLTSPLINANPSSYLVTLENIGGQALTISSTVISNTVANSFSLGSPLANVTIPSGSVRSFTVVASPTSSATLQGALTINSNDPTAASVKVNLQATPVNKADDFSSGSLSQLGWSNFASIGTNNSPWPTTDNSSSVGVDTAGNGTLKMTVDAAGGGVTPPWRYGVKKAFVSPGPLNLANSTIAVSLKASGSETPTNKVQVYLESLNPSGQPTGRLSLGQQIQESGRSGRVVLLIPTSDSFTTNSSTLASAIDESKIAINNNAFFDRYAPAFQIAVEITDFDFDDAGASPNVVEVDSIDLTLATDSINFEVTNSGFEADLSMGTNSTRTFLPAGWLQWARITGAEKTLMSSGGPVYNQFLATNDPTATFTPRTGTRALKVFPQYDYATNIPVGNTNYVWQSDWGAQKAVVYQEWNVSSVNLKPGDSIHAQVAAKVFSIDPLTGGSSLNFGFRYLNGITPLNSDNFTTLTASNSVNDVWRILTANGTVPANATSVQLVAEFVQTAANDYGSVYLDDASVGLGLIDPVSSNYVLTWSDEFDGTTLNTNNWTAETGGGGWGNAEQQHYTSRTNNLRVSNGSLIIEAKKENYSGNTWTSARIKTQEKRSFKYGKIEFRAKLPTGRGPWPAAWLLGNNISSVSWPDCGEIDVMEWRAGTNGSTSDMNTVGHALHSKNRNGGNSLEPTPARTPVTNPSTQFHTYAVLWESNKITFSVDGVNGTPLTPVDQPAFQKEFFLILNLAMGGNYLGGYIDSSLTQATYEVDYVRVYQDPATLSSPLDTLAPNFTYNGLNPVNLSWGASYTDAGVTAFDDGDNAAVTVTTNNPVNTGVPGSYLVTYTAKDSKSNSATTNRTVKVSMSNGGTNRGTDGLSDALRYAYGGTGTNPISTSLLPSNAISGSNLVLTYFARTNSNVTLTPVVSTDLSVTNSWTNSGVSVSTLSTTTTNGTVLEKRQATTPVSGPKKFLKLNVLFSNP